MEYTYGYEICEGKHGPVLVERAGLLTREERDAELAQHLLYWATQRTPVTARRFMSTEGSSAMDVVEYGEVNVDFPVLLGLRT